jgi:alanyl-tRNA synthetase
LTPLPKPSVDTGMGLERLAAVMQGVHNNYDTDLFGGLVQAAAELAGTDDLKQSSLRVIADHIRSCSFLITDGVLPSNEGRGYVLRRIIRRAIRHGYKLGIKESFFHKLVAPLCAEMGAAYPELLAVRETVERVLEKEEERFAETLEQGMKILDAGIKGLDKGVISGETAFQLYDTYGFPLDLTADVAREHGLSVDTEGFETAMNRQRERARAASQFASDNSAEVHVDGRCEFTGYLSTREETRVLAILKSNQAIDRLVAGDEALVVLGKTPFYAESGGQVGDQGVIRSGDATFDVVDTRKQGGDLILHWGRLVSGVLVAGADCIAEVDGDRRKATALNHSATHIFHAALRKVLGEHVMQKGSLVNPERLRFDFAHFEPMSSEQILAVERMVNQQVRANHPVTAEVMPKQEAMKAGAMALFGEKYGDEVRVLRIGAFSTELCGGIHAERAGDIGLVKIVSETGVAAGVRRLEAVTGQGALIWVETGDELIQRLAERVKSGRDGLDEKIQQLIDKNKQLERELDRLKGKMASAAGSDLASRAIQIDGVNVLVARLDDADPKSLRDLVDQLKNKLGSAAIVLAAVKEGKVSLIAGVTQDQTARIKAGDLVNVVASQVGGKGGGRPDLAQAGGNDPTRLDSAMNDVSDWVRQRLA